MELGVKERFLLGNFFPQKGTFKDQSLARSIRLKVVVDQAEREAIGFKVDGSAMSWNSSLEKKLAVELNDEEREFLKRQVNRLDEEAAYDPETYELAARIKEL